MDGAGCISPRRRKYRLDGHIGTHSVNLILGHKQMSLEWNDATVTDNQRVPVSA